ncbi:deoxyhypusine synthase family protein [Pseudohaliea sp.]|uniref:deoxyhypusine synthase family protein n=1 Tax=Pseudohaliea sp. TaxID=2740289 RepID=UPI0032ED0C55
MGHLSRFMDHHYRHFNAAAMMDAAKAYRAHIDAGRPMLVSLAGAMSTAELGLSLAEMIRQGKVHAISCTGANLEEDLYNLVAHDHYERVPHYRNLSDAEEQALLDRHLNRVTDTCIPEEEAIRRIEDAIVALWQRAGAAGEAWLPHEYFFELIRSGVLEAHYQVDPKDSWLVAAAEKDIPMVVPGWEDSTTGNIFAARVITGEVERSVMKGGIDYMIALADWYASEGGEHGFGFFQVGGGIAGDFPICVVPMLEQDLGRPTPKWSYFCQISDSTTSYGSYSGAVPNEKITWGKLAVDTPRFIIESDASIVAPLVFAYVLDW